MVPEHVTITADATLPGGLASFGYDDEGSPAKRTDLIDKGRLVNYLTSRETAARLDYRSAATCAPTAGSAPPSSA